MHHLAYLATLNDECCLHAFPHADEIMVYGTYGKEAWDGCMFLVNIPVAENYIVVTSVNAALRIMA